MLINCKSICPVVIFTHVHCEANLAPGKPNPQLYMAISCDDSHNQKKNQGSNTALVSCLWQIFLRFSIIKNSSEAAYLNAVVKLLIIPIEFLFAGLWFNSSWVHSTKCE